MSLFGSETVLELKVQDNGQGIQPGAASKLGHLGMASIMERAKSIGATLKIGPAADGGTCVRLHWQAPA